MIMENHGPKPHAVMIPAAGLQGHIIPFAHLAIKLASKGFIVTFVNTQSVHQTISKARRSKTTTAADQEEEEEEEEEYLDIFTEARSNNSCFQLDIRYVTISDGFPLGFDRSLNHDQFLEGYIHVFSAHVDDLVGKLVQTAHPPTCLIADTFNAWPSMIANKHNLVNISFWTEPAVVFSLYYHLDLLKINGHFACQDKREDTIDYVPGVEAIEPKDLMPYLQDANISTPLHRLIYGAFDDVKRADFVICNTLQELESKAISALQQKQPFYPIGPTFLSGFTNTRSLVSTSLWSESDCTQWLDNKPNGSVLYISFGSLAHCSKRDISEIAHGLSHSEVSFLWVLRPGIVGPKETDDILPVGFEDRMRDQGLIVPWCNQIAAISHQAVGGFLTHCGWNSIMESVWYGVPFLCFPLLTDQYTNRKLVVDDWRLGLNLCDSKPLTRCEVSRKTGRLMGGQSGDEWRKNVRTAREKLHHAASKVGSSHKNFEQLLDDVKTKIQEKHLGTAG